MGGKRTGGEGKGRGRGGVTQIPGSAPDLGEHHVPQPDSAW